jgi:hypothetical protein
MASKTQMHSIDNVLKKDESYITWRYYGDTEMKSERDEVRSILTKYCWHQWNVLEY